MSIILLPLLVAVIGFILYLLYTKRETALAELGRCAMWVGIAICVWLARGYLT